MHAVPPFACSGTEVLETKSLLDFLMQGWWDENAALSGTLLAQRVRMTCFNCTINESIEETQEPNTVLFVIIYHN